MTEYWRASEEVTQIADDYLPLHPDLIGAKIAYIFTDRTSFNDGVPIVGKVSKVPERLRPIMERNDDGEQGYDFIITIGADTWAELSQANREAWIDYLMEQCYLEEDKHGNLKTKIRKPSINAFPNILSRHGVAWDQGVNHLSVIDTMKKSSNITEEDTQPVLRPQSH